MAMMNAEQSSMKIVVLCGLWRYVIANIGKKETVHG
jgi:hypothetical protein